MIQKLKLLTILTIFSLILPMVAYETKAIRSDDLFDSFTTSNRDYWPTDGWRNSTPEDQGMSSVRLNEMAEFIEEEDINIHSIVVTRHGYIVYEDYFDSRYNENATHLLYSVTKSFTSSLMGIAIDKGYIDNTSQTMLSFFPDYEITNEDERREEVTIQDLLEMRSGIFWDESSAPYSSPANGVYHINTGDGVEYVLNLDMVAEPGELWHYNTGASHVLAAIVQVATETDLLEFARENLFDPMGIETVSWYRDMAGWYKGGFDLKLSTRSMAKFGYLFLNNGTWDEQQIISENWVNISTASYTLFDDGGGYGYQWWTNPELGYYYAAGLYGQYIFVVPEQDIVVAVTSGIVSGDQHAPIDILEEYILLDDTVDIAQSVIMASIIVIVVTIPIIAIIYYWRLSRRVSA